MKRLIAVILMLSSMAACSSVEDIPDLYGVISGTVMHKEQPVEGVEVVITPGGKSFVTKSNGTYTFESLESGSYTLTFKKKGYKTVTKNVNVSAGVNNLVDVNLDIDGNLVTADMDILNFGKTSKVMSFNIVNQLDRVVTWEIRQDNLPDWVSFKSLSGDVPSNSQNPVSVTVDRSKVKGEKDSFSLDIDISTGNALTVKVNVEAGKVGVVIPELWAIGYDYYQVAFVMGENCTKFCLGDDIVADVPVETIMKNGVFYEDDDYVIEFNCKDNPGIPHYLYIIPFNEFGQPGVMEVYKMLLDEEPAPQIQYTALKDINSADTYNVKDAYVAYADGWRAIITDDNGHTLFYMYFDSSYTSAHPKTGDILELSGEVKTYHNMLEFINPEFTVTGSGVFDDMIASDAIDYWNRFLIDDGSDMTSYCNLMPPGIRPVSLRGKLSNASDGYCSLDVEGTDVIGNLMNSDAAYFNDYVGKTVDFNGVAVGYNVYLGNYYLDIIVSDIEEVVPIKPSLESYLGYWNATVYNTNNEGWETWENLYLESFVDDETGQVKVEFINWMFGYPYSYFGTVGFYEESTGNIILEGNWSTGIYKYKDSDDAYRSYFTLFYNDGVSDDYSYIYPSRSEYSTAVLEYKDEDRNSMILTGDEQYPDENGNIANCFSFQIYNVTKDEYEGWYPVYRDIVFTRSSNPPAEATYSRSRSGKPRNCVEIDQVEAPRSFDARNFSGMTPKIL